MFDVVLARKLKKKKLVINLVNCLLIVKLFNSDSLANAIRDRIFRSLIQLWSESCTPGDCRMAASITGTWPFNPEIVLTSTMVHVLTEEERELLNKKRKNNRLNINGNIINNLEFLNQINQSLEFKWKHVYMDK